MNKKMMILLAGLIAVGPVLQVAASAEAMYNDIMKSIVEDKLTGESDHERFDKVTAALRQLKVYKEHAGNNIIRSHAQVDHDKAIGMAVGALGIGFSGVAVANHFKNFLVAQDMAACTVGGIVFTTLGLMLLAKEQVYIYYSKKKINELNTVITRLETMAGTLMKKLYPDMETLDQYYDKMISC